MKHSCLYYTTEEDYLSVVIPFLIRGLVNSQLCMWILFPGWKVENALAALKKKVESVENLDAYIERGQLEIVRCEEWYGLSAAFNPDEMLGKWRTKEEEVLLKGFKGLWVCGDGSWGEIKDWEKIALYEAYIDKTIHKTAMTALCTYSSKVFDVSHAYLLNFYHEFTVQSHNGHLSVLEKA